MHLPTRQDGVDNRDKVYWRNIFNLTSWIYEYVLF